MTPPLLSGLCDFHHISFAVKNLDISVDFYKRIFGFVEIKSFERTDLKGKVSFLNLKEMVLELWQFEIQKDNKDSMSDLDILGFKHLAFRTEDIKKVYENLKTSNILVDELLEGKMGTYFFFRDPDDFPIEIIQLYPSKR